MSQLRLFAKEPLATRPRRRPRRMMHVIDAGPGECEGHEHMVRMQCGKCDHETEWFVVASVTDGKRGRPCPQCNDSDDIAEHEVTP